MPSTHSHLVCKTNFVGKYHNLHFTVGETEAQRELKFGRAHPVGKGCGFLTSSKLVLLAFNVCTIPTVPTTLLPRA